MTSSLWKDVLSQLEHRYSRPNFITWLKPTTLTEDGDGLLTLRVPNEYAKSWIEKNALTDIHRVLADHYPNLNNLRVLVSSVQERETKDLPPLLETPTQTDGVGALEIEHGRLNTPPPKEFNPTHTFETFIVGNNNRLAFAASEAVADKPGEAYNPLFIYGGVGLGKTHLMQAIANRVVSSNPQKKIIYISCETFTSEFIQALQTKTVDSFKKKYRSVDVLLVDDIQFLANKEGTQEEFFHTFNILHQARRQIVMTSDRVPKDIPNLEERLSSRFAWGMVADVQSPNFETRVAILQEKAKEKNLSIPQEVTDYIANTITSNVRELEGSLTKLTITAQIEKQPITLKFTENVLRDLTQAKSATISTNKVIQTVAKYFSLEVIDILGKKRIKELVYPRQIVMYLLREKLNQSYPQIGEALGGKDHTTVMHSFNKISKAIKQDSGIEKDVSRITQELYN